MDGNILVMPTAWRENACSASWEMNLGVLNVGILLSFGVGSTWNIGSLLDAFSFVGSMLHAWFCALLASDLLSSLVSCLRSLTLGIDVSRITCTLFIFCWLLGALFILRLLLFLSPSDILSPSDVFSPSKSCGGLCLGGRIPRVLALVNRWYALRACLIFSGVVGVEDVGVKV